MAGCGGRGAATKMHPYIVCFGDKLGGTSFSSGIGGALELAPRAFLLNDATVNPFPHRRLLLSPHPAKTT